MNNEGLIIGKRVKILIAVLFVIGTIVTIWGLIRKGIEIHNDAMIIAGIIFSFTLLLFFFITMQSLLFPGKDEFKVIFFVFGITAFIIYISFVILKNTIYQRPAYDNYYWQKISQICNKQGIFETLPYNTQAKTHRTISNGIDNELYGEIPSSWFPNSIIDTEIVICDYKEVTKIIQTCSYEPKGSLKRYQYMKKVQLIEAHTGNIISEKTFYGGLPEKCPMTIGNPQLEYFGSRVSHNEIINWLKYFVER